MPRQLQSRRGMRKALPFFNEKKRLIEDLLAQPMIGPNLKTGVRPSIHKLNIAIALMFENKPNRPAAKHTIRIKDHQGLGHENYISGNNDLCEGGFD